MKLKRKDKIAETIKHLKVKHNSLQINYCGKIPLDIEKYFTTEENLKSFPPEGKLEATELDYFYYIMHKSSVVGFYRITDLYFNGVIELHSSFSKSNTFLIKSYFELTRIFISQIFILFPEKKIQTTVKKTNKNVIKFLFYLGFSYVSKDDNKDFLLFKKDI